MGDKMRKLNLKNLYMCAGEQKVWYVRNTNVKKDLYWKLKLYRDLCPPHQDQAISSDMEQPRRPLMSGPRMVR
jgi:hypothetical protein